MRTLTAAEERGMQFEKSGTDMWTSVNNAYVIKHGSLGRFGVYDGYGRFVAQRDTIGAAKTAAKNDLRSQ